MNLSLSELQNGNHKQFELFFEGNYARLCNFAYSTLRDMDKAEDVVQQSFITLWDQRQTIVIKGSVLSYLYRMVHNEIYDTVLKMSKEKSTSLDSIGDSVLSTDSVVNNVEYVELKTAIETEIAKLPAQCRKVFELSRFEQLSHKEIASELAISVFTVENHISKALKTLRVSLKEFLYLITLYFLINL